MIYRQENSGQMGSQSRADVTQQRLAALTTAALTPLVRQALNTPDAVLDGWRFSPLQGSSGGGTFTTIVYRFQGVAHHPGSAQPWSLILKVLYAVDGQDVSDSRYWKREAHAYQSGWLAHLPGSLVAPRCFGVLEYPEACWLWLEDVRDDGPAHWTLAHYETVARQLGAFSGAYLAGMALPDSAWLSRQWIRHDHARFGAWVAQHAAAAEHPLAQRLLSTCGMDGILELCAERERFLDVLERLPQTLCHFDAFRRNLLSRAVPPQTVAVDWAFGGIGPVGADLVALVWVGLVFAELPALPHAELDQRLFAHYAAGLRDAGWGGDPRLARLGYTAAIGLRRISSIGVALSHIEQGLMNEDDVPLLDRIAQSSGFIDGLTEEARLLMNSLGV
jgi:hypothetical protein